MTPLPYPPLQLRREPTDFVSRTSVPLTSVLGLSLAVLLACSAAAQEITIGVSLGTVGPAASFGVAYKNAFQLMPKDIAGHPIKYIIYEDRTNPAEAASNARKLVGEEHVDALMGSVALVPTTEMVEIANESKTPLLALAPVIITAQKLEWVFVLPQRPRLMMRGVVEHMKARGVQKVGYIGFSDTWSDFILNAFTNEARGAAAVQIVSNERYARSDSSVAAQVGRLIAANPDAILVGASGSGGALPHAALVERGYRKQIYHNHGTVSRQFITAGGKAVEGAIAPSGPLMVAEDLPEGNPIRPVALDFIARYEQTFGGESRNPFSGYSYDAFLLLNGAVPAALQKAKPGSSQFRHELRNALEGIQDLAGTNGVYNMSAKDHSGLDERARVLVRVEKGAWRLNKE